MSSQATSIIFFVAIIALTLVITVYASQQDKFASDHYVAGGMITGWQTASLSPAATSRRPLFS